MKIATPNNPLEPSDDVAVMVETGSPPVVTVTLDGEKYVPAAMLTRQSERIKELEARLRSREEWIAQFDCCVCGSTMKDHDIGSGHSPISIYDYDMDRAITRAEAAEKRNAELKTLLAEAVKVLEPLVAVGKGVGPNERVKQLIDARDFLATLKEKHDAE